MMLVILKVIILFGCIVREMETARILAVFPTPSISHQVVFRPLTQELAKRGHEVVVLTPNPVFPKGQAPKNLTEIDLQDLSYPIAVKGVKKITDLSKAMVIIFEILTEVFDAWLETDVMKQILKEKNKFDLLLVESCVKSTVGLSHIFKVPMIQVSSFGASLQNYESFGAPTHPFLYASPYHHRVYNLTIWEKVTIFFDYMVSDLSLLEEEDNKVLRKHFGPDFPPLRDLYSNVDMLFLNEHPIWSDNRPAPPGIVHIWGIHQSPEKELPEDLKSYLDSSPQGVIYFSLGSNVKTFMLPPATVEIMSKVLSELPYKVLWKWDLDKLPGEPKNIKLSKWLPQPDVLKHPNIKLFITQGGLQSTDEAIRAGVPFVGIPFFGDQFYNVEKYDKLKIGKYLYIEKLTEDNFREAILTVIGDQMYKDNVVKLRKAMHDQPESPLERAVWWTEHVLRHGGAKHLRAPAANMPWTQYYELDFLALLAAIICTVSTILVLSLRFILKRVLRAVKGSKLKTS